MREYIFERVVLLLHPFTSVSPLASFFPPFLYIFVFWYSAPQILFGNVTHEEFHAKENSFANLIFTSFAEISANKTPFTIEQDRT